MRTRPNPLLLLVGVGFLGWGGFLSYGLYSPTGLRLVAAGCLALGLAAAVSDPAPAFRSVLVPLAVVILIVWQGEVLVRATTYYGKGHWLSDARYLSIALPTVGAAAVVATGRAAGWWWRAVVALFGLGAIATILSSPRPAIDVWYLIQHASNCVIHGCNPYTMHTPASPGVTDGFNYLPMTALLLMPFHVLIGDVRYGEAAAIVIAAIAVRRIGGVERAKLAPLFLCVPGLFFQVEQAWNESLLVALLLGAVWAVSSGADTRRQWLTSGVLLGLALGTKQHAWLLLPVAAITLGVRAAVSGAAVGVLSNVPWFVADPSAFWRDTVTMFTHIDPRIDATTLWLHEPAHTQTALAIVVVALAFVLAWVSCRGHPKRFLFGGALVLAAFDLMNKQSFYNQWALVIWLAVAAAVVEHAAVSVVRREVMT